MPILRIYIIGCGDKIIKISFEIYRVFVLNSLGIFRLYVDGFLWDLF